MILRYEEEVRSLVDSVERAQEVRRLRVDQASTWRRVGEDCKKRWGVVVGEEDEQSLGATICHVAAEVLGEDPDSEPWN